MAYLSRTAAFARMGMAGLGRRIDADSAALALRVCAMAYQYPVEVVCSWL
jgi:hypothetical protein